MSLIICRGKRVPQYVHPIILPRYRLPQRGTLISYHKIVLPDDWLRLPCNAS